MKYSREVNMVFDVIDLELDRSAQDQIGCSETPTPAWFQQAMLTSRGYNQIRANYNGNGVELTVWGKDGNKTETYLPVTLSWNPTFGIEIVHDPPWGRGVGVWKRVCDL